MKALPATPILLAAMMLGGQVDLVHGAELTIGVMASDAGPQRSVGKQITVGAEIGVERLRTHLGYTDTKLEFATGDFSDRKAVEDAYRGLVDRGANVVIGGATANVAEAMRTTAAEFKIPTILMTATATSGVDANTQKHILQLGLPPEEIYRTGLGYWLSEGKIDKLSVVYDQAHDLTRKYGVDLTQSAIQSLGNKKPEYQADSFSGGQISRYEKEIDEVKAYQPDGIIVSALPWDTANLVFKVSKEYTTAPFFVALSPSSTSQLEYLAGHSYVPIHYGGEFWPDLRNDATREFIAEARGKLGWSEEASASIIAIKAHDAVQVAGVAWKDGKLGSEDSIWDIKVVKGLTGNLTLRDDLTMAGPLSLVTAEPGGGFRTVEILP